MNKLHLFNPENDLALGLGCRHYTPPPHAVAIHNAGALLPMWWADEGDCIIATKELAAGAEKLRDRFGLHGEIFDGQDCDGLQAAPWGWSADAKRQFLSAGVAKELLPDDTAIEKMRLLSHRRMSIEILSRLDRDCYPMPLETTDPQMVVEAEKKNPGCFVKSPWSGSGRGVFCARSLSDGALLRRAEGIIHRQGSVMVERGLDKVLDFAALFRSDGEGEVKFLGLSVFKTEARGMYSGNIVAPQTELESILAGHIDLDGLHDIISQEEKILSELTGRDYAGYMGVDMMIHRENGVMKVMPCVELNLRMTMGVVAMLIQERLGVSKAQLLSWQHGVGDKSDENSTVLLPPTDGFELRLSPFQL